MSVLNPTRAATAGPGAEPETATHVACGVVVVSSVVAALTHLWVVPEHAEEWAPAAVFFVVVAGLQLALAWLVRRPPAPLVAGAGLLGTVALVVFYVATRTVDLPFLPAHHLDHLPVAWGIGNGVPVFPGDRTEEVGVPDLVCLVAELATVLGLLSLTTPRTRVRVTNGLLGLGLAMVVLRVVGVPG